MALLTRAAHKKRKHAKRPDLDVLGMHTGRACAHGLNLRKAVTECSTSQLLNNRSSRISVLGAGKGTHPLLQDPIATLNIRAHTTKNVSVEI